MKDSNLKISSKIRKLRFKLGWTQNKLSNLTKISQSTICRMEVDCANVRLIYVVKILNALSNFDIFKSNLLSLQESEISEFLEKVKKNDKAWSIINYDPKKAAVIFIYAVKKEFK